MEECQGEANAMDLKGEYKWCQHGVRRVEGLENSQRGHHNTSHPHNSS